MAEDTKSNLAILAGLGEALANAANDEVAQEQIIDEILDNIGKLSPNAAKLLLQHQNVQDLLEGLSDHKAQTSNDAPGTIRPGWVGNTQVNGFTKKDWTEADLRERRDSAGKLLTFIPTETIQVFWNGLRRQLIAEEEITIEKCFYDVYMEHRRATRAAKDHAEYLFRKRETLIDPSMVTPEGARARGTAEIGWYVPGGGSIIAPEAPPNPAAPQAAPAEPSGEGGEQ